MRKSHGYAPIAFKVILRENCSASFQPLVVHHPAPESYNPLTTAFAHLRNCTCSLVVYPKADSYNHWETIMFYIAIHIAAAFRFELFGISE